MKQETAIVLGFLIGGFFIWILITQIKEKYVGGYFNCTQPDDSDCGMAQIAVTQKCTPPYVENNTHWGQDSCMYSAALPYTANEFGMTVEQCKADATCSQIALQYAQMYGPAPMNSPAQCSKNWWLSKAQGGMC